MAEERENQKGNQKGEPDFELHSQKPLLDEGDSELAKLKLANDEDDDVEAHSQKPHQTGG